MKIKSFVLTSISVFALVIETAFGQRINPHTGLPEADGGGQTSATTINDDGQASVEIHSLVSGGQYDEALSRCVAFHDGHKSGSSLILILSDWVELGRRYPKAKTELVDIRNHDVHEFSAGRGYADLFLEVSSINHALHEDDATYDLFKSFRNSDPDLAQQCYFYVEGLLMAKGEYQWCYDHMGDAQGRFEMARQSFNMQLDNQRRMTAINEATRLRVEEMNRQRGQTNIPAFSPPDTSAMLKRSAESGFVGQNRNVIEILVATGHKAQAEKIRDQALAVLDDERLRSAVADAEAKVKK